MDDNQDQETNSSLISQPTVELTEEEKEINVYVKSKKELKEEKISDKKLYIINKDWFNKWKCKINYYTHQCKPLYRFSTNPYRKSPFEGHLPPINNGEIAIDPSTYLRTKDDTSVYLKPDLERRDIKAIDETVWQMLENKYQGGPPINFFISKNDRYNQIEDLMYYEIKLIILPLKTDLITSEESTKKCLEEMKEYTIMTKRPHTLQETKDKISQIIIENNIMEGNPTIEQVSNENIRLWLLDDSIELEALQKQLNEKAEEISKSNEEIDIANLFTLQCIEEYKKDSLINLFHDRKKITLCLERQTSSSMFIFKSRNTCQIEICSEDRTNGLMTVCCPCKEAWYCNIACYNKDKRFHERHCERAYEEVIPDKKSSSSKNGLCGLINMGNTCFMNTSLQCLSNCYYLTQYFITDSYQKDINQVNPLGTKGMMATAYSNLLKNMWYGSSSVVKPANFKKLLGKYLKMFSGYQQHDTQEFLNYLLDLLHEDLNKVLAKPCVEKDENDYPDNIKSNLHWISFLRRNQSFLLDLFWGQYKSTLICPEETCKNISITFEPFLTLSLPLVSKTRLFIIQCYFIFNDINLTPIMLKIPFYQEATFMAFRNKISKILNIHPWSFVIVKIENNRRINEFIPETTPLYKPCRYPDDTKYFLFQIDAKLFYSPLNSQLQLLNENYENTIYETTFQYYKENKEIKNDDLNHIYSANYEEISSNPFTDSTNLGLRKEIVGVVIKMLSTYHNDQIIFPRVVFLNKSLKMRELYLYFFKYFYRLIKENKEDNSIDDNIIEEDFNKRYTEELKDEESFTEAYKNKSIPFHVLYLPKDYSQDHTKIFPYDDSLLEFYVNAFQTKEENEKIHYYNYNENKLFTLSIVWHHDYSMEISKTLNAMVVIKGVLNEDHYHSKMSIYDCLNRFSQTEVLGENNEWYCSKCKEHRRATKKIEIYKSPNILIVHLKRFTNNTKLDTVVDFPIKDFDISKFVLGKTEENVKYDLFAIGNHYGSMGFGHYAAYAKNHDDDLWYEFNDSQVSRVREDVLVSSSAYVLFYNKQNIDSIDWKEVYNKPFFNHESENKETDKPEEKTQGNAKEKDNIPEKEEKPALNEEIPQEEEIPPSE